MCVCARVGVFMNFGRLWRSHCQVPFKCFPIFGENEPAVFEVSCWVREGRRSRVSLKSLIAFWAGVRGLIKSRVGCSE